MTAVAQQTPPSFCIDCDAAEGQCAHVGHRYYETYMDHPDYKPGSGQVADEWKDWFHRNEHPASTEKREPKARELSAIFSGLEASTFIDERLTRLLREKYETHPLRVSQMATEVQLGAESGRIKNPGGLLSKMLAELS